MTTFQLTAVIALGIITIGFALGVGYFGIFKKIK